MTGEEPQGEPIPASEGWLIDTGLQDDELLTEQGNLEQELRLGTDEIKCESEHEGSLREPSPTKVEWFELARQA